MDNRMISLIRARVVALMAAQFVLDFVHRGRSVQKLQVFLLAFDLLHPLIDDFVLVGPVSGIDEGSHVVAIIVAAFRVKVEGRRKNGAFVSIYTVEGEESLYFCCQFIDVCVDLLVIHSIEHGNWAEPLDFPEFAEHAKLGIGQSHILFVCLCHLSCCQWAQLSRGCGFQDILNDLELMKFIEVIEDFSEPIF